MGKTQSDTQAKPHTELKIISALRDAGYAAQIAPGVVNGVMLARVLRVQKAQR